MSGKPERMAPCDLEAEQGILGEIMVAPHVIPDLLRIIPRDQAECFFRPIHRRMFQALVDMYDAGRSLDLVTVRNELARVGLLGEVGGVEYIVECVEAKTDPEKVADHAEIVRDKAHLRRLIQISADLQDEAYSGEQSPKNLIDQFESELQSVVNRRIASQAARMHDEVYAFLQELEQRRAGCIGGGVPTGFYELDETLGGLHKGEMVVVAGRPSMGKTAFGLNVAESIADREKVPVLFFSLEMTRRSVTERIICGRADVDMLKVRRGTIDDLELARLKAASDQVQGLSLFIDDTSRLSLFDMRAKARQAVRCLGAGVIVVDYLQLMRLGGRTQSRQQEIAEISGGMKDLAKTLDVPVVVLSQLNRNPEGRSDNRPRMSDLRESGAIEQDADVVILLHREEYYRKHDCPPDLQGVAEIIVDKQRNGPTGIIRLHWNGKLARFCETSEARLADAEDTIRAYQAHRDAELPPAKAPLLHTGSSVPF